MEFLARLEQSGFSTWVRESTSVWAYPTVLFLHTLGLGFLVGASMVIDLRLLGFSNELPIAPMKKVFPGDVVRLLGECVVGPCARHD
jgi:hypothetical protein